MDHPWLIKKQPLFFVPFHITHIQKPISKMPTCFYPHKQKYDGSIFMPLFLDFFVVIGINQVEVSLNFHWIGKEFTRLCLNNKYQICFNFFNSQNIYFIGGSFKIYLQLKSVDFYFPKIISRSLKKLYSLESDLTMFQKLLNLIVFL